MADPKEFLRLPFQHRDKDVVARESDDYEPEGNIVEIEDYSDDHYSVILRSRAEVEQLIALLRRAADVAFAESFANG